MWITSGWRVADKSVEKLFYRFIVWKLFALKKHQRARRETKPSVGGLGRCCVIIPFVEFCCEHLQMNTQSVYFSEKGWERRRLLEVYFSWTKWRDQRSFSLYIFHIMNSRQCESAEFGFIHNREWKWKLCADTAHNKLGYLITLLDIEVSASSIRNLIRIFPIYVLIFQPLNAGTNFPELPRHPPRLFSGKVNLCCVSGKRVCWLAD